MIIPFLITMSQCRRINFPSRTNLIEFSHTCNKFITDAVYDRIVFNISLHGVYDGANTFMHFSRTLSHQTEWFTIYISAGIWNADKQQLFFIYVSCSICTYLVVVVLIWLKTSVAFWHDLSRYQKHYDSRSKHIPDLFSHHIYVYLLFIA